MSGQRVSNIAATQGSFLSFYSAIQHISIFHLMNIVSENPALMLAHIMLLHLRSDIVQVVSVTHTRIEPFPAFQKTEFPIPGFDYLSQALTDRFAAWLRIIALDAGMKHGGLCPASSLKSFVKASNCLTGSGFAARLRDDITGTKIVQIISIPVHIHVNRELVATFDRFFES